METLWTVPARPVWPGAAAPSSGSGLTRPGASSRLATVDMNLLEQSLHWCTFGQLPMSSPSFELGHRASVHKSVIAPPANFGATDFGSAAAEGTAFTVVVSAGEEIALEYARAVCLPSADGTALIGSGTGR